MDRPPVLLAERYELRKVLGRGGMGEVHEAIARGADGFERRVAIKRLFAEAAFDVAERDEFFDEARIASQLHHGGIVSILDYGIADGAPFQVLELVDGVTAFGALALGRAAGQPMPVAVALHIVTEAAHALHFAHTARDARGRPLGIVHRDVKPTNILLSRSGDVKVSDFGIAKAQGRLSATTANVVKGTPGFRAPEQLLAGVVDARTDVFALGATLHALMTGVSPARTPESEHRLLAGDEISLDPNLPDDVRAIVARAMRREPDARYASALEMAQATGRLLATKLRGDAKSLILAWLMPLVAREGDAAAPAAPTDEAQRADGPSVASGPSTRVLRARGANATNATNTANEANGSSKPNRTATFVVPLVVTLLFGGTVVASMIPWVLSYAAGEAAKRELAETLTPPITVAAPSASELATPKTPTAPTESSNDVTVERPTTAQPPRRPELPERPTKPQPAQVKVAAKGGRCACISPTGDNLCPRELVKPMREGCECYARNEGVLFTANGAHRVFASASGLGGEACEGHASAGEKRVTGVVRCSLCGWFRSYDGPPNASCEGLSGLGPHEESGQLRCR